MDTIYEVDNSEAVPDDASSMPGIAFKNITDYQKEPNIKGGFTN